MTPTSLTQPPVTPWWRGLALSLIASVIVVLGAATATAVTVTGDTSGLDIAQVKRCDAVNLVIDLPEQNPYDEVAEGQLPPGPLDGTTFTVRRLLDVDLSTPEGWEMVTTMTVDEAHHAELGAPHTAITNSEGRATFTGLPVGFYLVTAERPTRDGVSYKEIAPFLITLPIGQEGRWSCAVQIIAKPLPDVPPITHPPIPSWVPTPTPVPPSSGTPQAPTGTLQTPQTPQPPSIGRLPMTGASVLALLGGSVLLIGGGILAVGRGRARARNSADTT